MSFARRIKELATEHGFENAVRSAIDLVKAGKVDERDLGLRSLAQGFLGDEWEHKLQLHQERALEAADAISASAFAAISGNQLIERVREGYRMAPSIGDQIATTIPVTNGNLTTQKEPWLSNVRLKTSAELLTQEGIEFPDTEFSKSYVLYAAPEKRGHKVRVTFEMIYADRTRQANESAMSVGEMLKLDKEKRILRAFLGTSGGARFTYSFDGGTEASSNTYIEDSTTGTLGKWENQLDSTPLVSWVDINAVEQKFAKMRDPVTNEPIDIDAKQIFVMPSRVHLARSILNAELFRLGSYAVTAGSGNNNVMTQASNPLMNYELLTSKHAQKIAALNETFTDQANANAATITVAQAEDLWLMGDFKRAFYYREVHPLDVRMLPPGNPDEINKDIFLAVRAKEYGVAGVWDPRFTCRIFGHAQNASTS